MSNHRAGNDTPHAGAWATLWPIVQALVAAALDGGSEAELLVALAAALTRAGLALSTVEVACDVVDAERADRFLRWHRGKDEVEGAIRARALFRSMVREGAAERRLGTAPEPFASLVEEGVTDAIAFAGHLAPEVTVGFFDDVMCLFATDRPGGFTAAEVELLRDVTPVFTLAMGARLNAAAARTLLETYLGQGAATALLAGRVGLGDVATIRAVVLYCDLVGFTSLTEQLDARALIAHLNLFFETVTRPLARAGGQVSGHVGDAIVMFFPIPDAASEPAVCAAAAQAAREALRQLSAINDAHALAQTVPLRARIGIDVGAVVHGNVGSAGRFSFTIIGTPVNRAARLQALAKEVDAAMLTTAELARTAGVRLRAYGRHVLRGFDHPVDAVGLDGVEDLRANRSSRPDASLS